MRHGNKKIILSAWIMSSAVIFIAGCDSKVEERAGDNNTNTNRSEASVGMAVDDSVITAKVKSRMLSDPIMKGLGADVETVNGTVQLSGFVENKSQMERAIEIAHDVEGVKSVENKMSIRN